MSNNDTILNCYLDGKIEGWEDIGLLTVTFSGYNIKNCQVKGEIIATEGGYIGGMISNCNADSVINCSSEVTIQSNDNFVGGLIGYSVDTNLIKFCYSKCDIISTEGKWIGGLIGGITAFEEGTISNSVSEGSIFTDSLDYIGGFVGQLSLLENFSINNSYSDIDITGDSFLGGGCC